MDYCAPGDLYSFGGLQPGALANPARLSGPIDPAADTIALDQHGFSPDARVLFRAVSGGSLPLPLSAGVAYFALPITESLFSVALTPGGSAIDLTTPGARVLVCRQLPIAESIAWSSRVIDQNLPAHAVPKDGEPIHELVKMTCAELAAGHLLSGTGGGSATLSALVDAAVLRLAKWAKGIPLRGPNAPQPTNLAATPVAAFSVRAKDWTRYGGTT